MSRPIGTSHEQLRIQRMELYERVYTQLPLQEQVDVDSVVGDWANQLPRFGPAMGKELLVAIALLVAEKCEEREARLQQGKPCSK